MIVDWKVNFLFIFSLEESIVRLFAFGRLQPGEMTTDMTLVKNILGSKAGLFLFDNYQVINCQKII